MKKTMMALFLGSTIVSQTVMAQEWYETMKLKGDLRYRYENIDDETKDVEQQRDRIRARLGVFAKVNKDVDAAIQLTTSGSELNGQGDPVSGNQTLTGGGSKKPVYLDLGYIDYHPEMLKGLDVIGGKMSNPFITVADNIFDGDYNPEGLALKYKTGDEVQFLANAAYHWLEERSGSEDEAMQYGAQAAVKYNKDEDNYAQVGGSYYGTENLEGERLLDNSSAARSKSFGNSTVKSVAADGTTNSLYASEYNVMEAFAEAGFMIGIPSRVYASYSVNDDAETDDTGYLIGVTLGKAKDPGTFEGGYNWRSIEKDAVLGALADSDAGGGGTNIEGHKLFVRYQALKNLQLSATYFMDKKDPDGKDTDYDRLQVDAIAKF